jgi:hypothetical protein
MKSVFNEFINIPSGYSKQDAIIYLQRLRLIQVQHLVRMNQPKSKHHNKKIDIDNIISHDSIIQKIDKTLISLQKFTNE